MFKSVTYPHLPVILNSNSKILNYMPRLSHRRKYPLLLSSMKLHLKYPHNVVTFVPVGLATL